MKKYTSVGISPTTLEALKDFKERFDFHSLDEAINQLLLNAKATLLKLEAKKE